MKILFEDKLFDKMLFDEMDGSQPNELSVLYSGNLVLITLETPNVKTRQLNHYLLSDRLTSPFVGHTANTKMAHNTRKKRFKFKELFFSTYS